ncbi:MAG: HvfC/BufC family peptide modification chaperone, partial [Gammaproteobacteria bacterium]
GLHALLGDEAFSRMVQAYLEEHPSRHPSVRWFGQHLPAFLSAHPEYAGHPVLAEMARFEWAWGLAFDAADRTSPGVAALAEIAPETWGALQVEVQPSVQQLQLIHNVPAIFQAATNGSDPPPIEAAQSVNWVLWRRELIVCWRSLEPDEAWALAAMAGGASFARLCEGLRQWHEDEAVPLRAAGMLRGWLENDLLAGIST